MRSPGLTNDAACFVAGFSGGLALHVYGAPPPPPSSPPRPPRHFTVGRRASRACDPAGRTKHGEIKDVIGAAHHRKHSSACVAFRDWIHDTVRAVAPVPSPA